MHLVSEFTTTLNSICDGLDLWPMHDIFCRPPLVVVIGFHYDTDLSRADRIQVTNMLFIYLFDE